MSVITLEIGKARKPYVCECCGMATHSTHGFIYRDNEAFAVYQAGWCEGHPEDQVNARIEIGGDWGDPAIRPKHVFFCMLIFRTPRGDGFSMLDPEESMWFEDDIEGEFLSREAALSHSLKNEIFHIAEHVARDDKRINGFLDQHPINRA